MGAASSGFITASEDDEDELPIETTESEDGSDTEQDNGVVEPSTSRDIGTTRDAADLGIIANETGGDVKSDTDDHGTITDDYEADSEEPVTAFDSRRYSEVTGGMSELSMTDTIICVGFGYALVYAS